MTEYLYIILKSDGFCTPLRSHISGPEDSPETLSATMNAPMPDLRDALRKPPFPAQEELPSLLAAGWRPLRETSMGDGHTLIILERDHLG